MLPTHRYNISTNTSRGATGHSPLWYRTVCTSSVQKQLMGDPGDMSTDDREDFFQCSLTQFPFHGIQTVTHMRIQDLHITWILNMFYLLVRRNITNTESKTTHKSTTYEAHIYSSTLSTDQFSQYCWTFLCVCYAEGVNRSKTERYTK